MKASISRAVSGFLTSRFRRDLQHVLNRRPGAPTVHYFHQVDDPYSHLAAQTLRPLVERYRIDIQPWLTPPPDAAAAPEPDRLRQYALRDAVRLASEYGLSFPKGASSPSVEASLATAAWLAPRLGSADFPEMAVAAGERLWSGSWPAFDGARAEAAAAALRAGEAERARRGHYLGAMFLFEGEWFWGVDRLNHLEERLACRGLDRAPPGTPALAPYRDARPPATPVAVEGARPRIDFWFSFRSPYSWIVFPRVRRLARAYGAELRLRYILPMVMRGLPVPSIKRRYIMLDTKREAERVDEPFGRIVDPVGKGAARALAVVHHAVGLGLAEEFAEAAMRAAFAEGIDLADDAAFYAVARQAGLTDAQVDAALADESWRAVAEQNREALFDAGLWGAPTYRVNGMPAHWGQDRLWALEADLKQALRI